MKKIFAIISFTFIALQSFAQKPDLYFTNEETFKIVQFTDLHWDAKSDRMPQNVIIIEKVLQTEKPDLIVLTGDIVTAPPEEEAWRRLITTIEKFKTPWTITFGNHDEDHHLKKPEIFKMMKSYPYFLGEEGNVSGVGNFTLPIYGNKNKVESVLYFMDSHAGSQSPALSKYDWIKFDQIDWFRKQSDLYTAKNNNSPVPSLAFLHIPLPEYEFIKNDENTIGTKRDNIGCPDFNSGVFTAFSEKKNIMGVFVGHAHNNNFIGMYKNIALGYGNVSGLDAYGKLPRGGRVIVLKKGKFVFDSWIRTEEGIKDMFHYPLELKEILDTTKLLKSIKVKPTKNGINYKYYELDDNIKSVQDITKFPIKKQGIYSTIFAENITVKNHFGYVYFGYIFIPETTNYKFYTYSDEGSLLKIDDIEIVNNDGVHGPLRKENIVALEKGFHKIEVLYFENAKGQVLEVGISSPYFPEMVIPESWLYSE